MSLASVQAQYQRAIRNGMARTLWTTSYADYADQWHDNARHGDGGDDPPDKAKGGQNWEKIAPATPAAAVKAADDLVELYEKAGGQPLWTLFMIALYVDRDLDNEYELEAENEGDLDVAGMFGSDLAMQALGHGVGWSDSHKLKRKDGRAQLDIPRVNFECRYDGENLDWSGGFDAAPLPSIGRIVIVNGDDRSWTRHRYLLAVGNAGWGAFADRLLLIYANSLDDALDEAIDWMVDNEPGFIADDQVEEAYHRARSDGQTEEQARETAEEGMISGGNAGNHIAVDAIRLLETDPTRRQLESFGTARQDEH